MKNLEKSISKKLLIDKPDKYDQPAESNEQMQKMQKRKM